MHAAALPPTGEETELSPWWGRTVWIVLIVGLAGLLFISALAYRDAPPTPAQVVDESGQVLFTGQDVRGGQAVFLKYGLMNNGSIWGHGAYLGPDYAAETLHQMGQYAAAALAAREFHKPLAELDTTQKEAAQAGAASLLKVNRYDPAADTLTFIAAQAATWKAQQPYWTDYLRHPETNGGLRPDAITDPAELHRLAAFITWAAWASVANRPDAVYSYTNNFPYDPSVGNTPAAGAVLWSALSFLVLLGGIGGVLLVLGRFDYLGWTTEDKSYHLHPRLLEGAASPGQKALVKFFIVVTGLFLVQTLVGGAAAHYRADPGSFYGFQLESIFPSNLVRTWHLQSAIFWIATAYVAAALFLARSLRRDEPKSMAAWTHFLFVAFAIVIGGSMLGEWAGMWGKMGGLWFWFGNQGWEYLELGRAWQYLLIVGLIVWFAMIWTLARPRDAANPQAKPLARLFLWASLAIPVFYLPAVFYGAETNFTVVDLWRFWIVHLWVEGFFEFFATTVVALTFFQMGITKRNVALRVIYMDAILFFAGGMLGTGHHWYFSGQGHLNMAVSALVSALEVVPLTLLTLDAWDFVRTTREGKTQSGEQLHVPHKWTFYFLMSVGFWNFLGAGVFGFLINTPIVSYFETGTQLTPNHGHASLMGVFGMLALALTVFVLRQVTSDKNWPGIEKYVKVAFWGTNLGLLMMVVMSLFPSGILQTWDVLQHGYWHARSVAFTHTTRAFIIEWLRLPGDLVFIIFGSIPITIAAIKTYLGMRADAARAKAPAAH
ncbi:nitric-oxide reductase large subunit [Castellaniella hirudinis]|uniref:nitric-oxide reductase large subunit n=1 Tax=Castellaniella hirudinis TaxID=1144617 RepID=UPI0039C38D88